MKGELATLAVRLRRPWGTGGAGSGGFFPAVGPKRRETPGTLGAGAGPALRAARTPRCGALGLDERLPYLLAHGVHDAHEGGEQLRLLAGGELLLRLLLAALLGPGRGHARPRLPPARRPRPGTCARRLPGGEQRVPALGTGRQGGDRDTRGTRAAPGAPLSPRRMRPGGGAGRADAIGRRAAPRGVNKERGGSRSITWRARARQPEGRGPLGVWLSRQDTPPLGGVPEGRG